MNVCRVSEMQSAVSGESRMEHYGSCRRGEVHCIGEVTSTSNLGCGLVALRLELFSC